MFGFDNKNGGTLLKQKGTTQNINQRTPFTCFLIFYWSIIFAYIQESSSSLLTLVREFHTDDMMSQFYIVGTKLSPEADDIDLDSSVLTRKISESFMNRKSRIEHRLRTKR